MKSKLEELLEKATPTLTICGELSWGQYHTKIRPKSDAENEANLELWNRAPALARSHEALASTLQRVFSNMAKFDSHSEDGKLYVRCIYCNAIGCFESGKSTGHIPHKEHCLIAVAEKVLAEAEKVSNG